MLKTFIFDLPVLFLVALGSGTILAATLVYPSSIAANEG